MPLAVRPLTLDLWPALEDLFGRAGASNGCWCAYWLVGPSYRTIRERNRAALREAARRGPPPGLVAIDGDLGVGWCRLTPRGDLPWLDANPRIPRVDDLPVWSLPCLYVRRSHRRRGVASVLVAAALWTAKDARAPALEAYPVDTTSPGSTSNLFTGTASTFRRAGFATVARGAHGRLVMRHDLERIRLAVPDGIAVGAGES